MISQGPGIYTVVIQVRGLHRRPCARAEWALCPGRMACLLSPQVQIKEETRLVSIIDQIDNAVAVVPRGVLFKTPFGPVHVNRTFEGEFSGFSLPRAGQRLFRALVGHISGSLGEPAHFLREGTAVATSLWRMCARAWLRWLAWTTQSLDADPFLPWMGEHLATWVSAPCLFPPSSSLVSPHCRIWAKFGLREYYSLFSLQFSVSSCLSPL